MTKEYKDESFIIKIEEGIIFIDWLKEHYTYDEVDKGMKIRFQLTNGKTYPILSDFSKVKSGTREAKQRLAEQDGQINVSALAIICRNRIQKTLITIFNYINNPPITTKVFVSKPKAIKWLKENV